MCDEIINVTDSLSTNVKNTITTNITNTISTNVTIIVSINSNDKKVRYKMNCYILYMFQLVIILLLIIAIICHRYIRQKHIGALTISKWKIMG